MPALDEGPSIRALASELVRATDRAAGEVRPLVILYSGGIDSSLLAWCLREKGPRLFTVGLPGAPDLVAATEGARALGLPHSTVEVREPEVSATWAGWADELGRLREPALSVAVTEILAFERAPPGRLVVGQGADELFHGYAHFRGLNGVEAEARVERDLTRLLEVDWPRARKLASRLGREVVAPYLDPTFVRAARGFSGAHSVEPAQPTKPVLRAVARELGLPGDLIDRPKKAMQYGSRVAHVVRRLQTASTAVRSRP